MSAASITAPASVPRRGVLIGWTVAALLTIGTWLYLDLQRELRAVAQSTLRSLVDAQVIALDIWVQEKQLNVQRWAADPRIVELTERLVRSAETSPRAFAAECRDGGSPALQRLIEQLRSGEVANAANLIDPNGRVLAAGVTEHCGLMLRAERLQALAPVFTGAATFSPPLSDDERLDAGRAGAARQPLVWLSAPVHGSDGRVIAALNVGKIAADRFSRVMAVARSGRVGEAYAFDRRGHLLSESRYREALEERGALAAGASSILSVRIESPGAGEGAPLTLLIERALDNLDRDEGAQISGEVLTPYVNYVGATVVGAWRWLPAYGFGVAVEIGKDEIYAPLRHLEYTVSSVWVVAAAVLLALTLATIRISRLRRERDEARQVGNYELLEEIGAGGMARVYRARHRLLKRPVAVKIIDLRHSSDENLARFEREARLAGQLMHPNTVAIFDYGRVPDGQLFYAMELLDGLTLQQLVERDGIVPQARAAHVLHGIAGSLSEAHLRGLVHRDIKPGNVMVSRSGDDVDVVKVLDFGLVKNVAEPETRDLTKALRILGTPAYLAPERIEHPEGADHRSDIYSLGAVGYFLVSGRPPFAGDDPLALAYRIVHAPLEPLRDVVPGALDDQLIALIEACLAKDPAARPQDAREVIDALDRILRRMPWSAADARASWREAAPTGEPRST